MLIYFQWDDDEDDVDIADKTSGTNRNRNTPKSNQNLPDQNNKNDTVYILSLIHI